MAVAKQAELIGLSPAGPHVSYLQFQMAEADFAGFQGGRYIILNTGLPLPDGKAIKRAYSILACDPATRRVTIGIKALPQGQASSYLTQLKAGQSFAYSGPWGKLALPNQAEWESLGSKPLLFLASYTGISALMGVLSEVEKGAYPIDMHWFRPDASYFIEDARVLALAQEKGVRLSIHACADTDTDIQAESFRLFLSSILIPTYSRALLAGDGRINRLVRQHLEAQAMDGQQIIEEIFFNKAVN